MALFDHLEESASMDAEVLMSRAVRAATGGRWRRPLLIF